MAHSRGFYRPRGPPPRFPPSHGRPPPPLMRSPSPRFVGQPRAPFSSDFVIGGGPLQDVKPPRRAPVAGARHNTPLKKPAHLCVGFDASQRFPNAKERLHNVLQGAMKGNSMRFDSREVGDKWQATVNIPWPREMSFYGEGPSKKEAEKNVAAIACVELERFGVANISSAMVIKKEAVQSKDEPKWIYIDDDRLTKVESFLLKNSVLSQQLYRNQNQPLVQPQPFPKDQSSSAIKPNNPESGKQAEASNVNEDDRKDAKAAEFWKDSDVRDADFSNWETPSAAKTSQLEGSQSKTSSSLSTDVTVNSKEVKDIFSGSPWKALSPEQLANHNEQLLGEYKQRQIMLESRSSWFSEETKNLPVANYREKIVDLIEANKVVVLSGETGCGKTTQIPQFILDHAIKDGKGASCNIVVTQPRRIVAMSIAERVAWERGEVLGKSIGYQVRLEGKPPTQYGRILFCTTGILLRRMQNNALLQGVSHVIVDEVHERDINTDFLLILLKELLDENQLLKVIVMSATVNSERFSQYFQGCPSLNIPGFTHSVTEYFLPDVQKMLGGRGMSSMPSPPQSKRFKPNNSSAKDQNDIESPEADAELISEVILHVCRNYQEGAILCFLSGWDEITLVHDILASKISDSCKSQFLVLPLHSMLPMFNQRTVFERPPVGVRKIVLATNIAETSITIDDVVYVINAGNEKEQMYDAANKVSCLVTNWTSQASVVQRRGRAGRCKPGFCFNLFSKEQFENMSPYQSAEMQRISLEEIVLQTKIQCSDPSCKVQEFLSKALDPPSPTNVQSAISELQEIGAMDNQEDLTALGKYLAYLPVEPRIAKMIIYGAIFRCLDPILTIAAGLSYKDPFVTPLNCRLQADQSRKAFTHGSKSDHVALLNAYNGWTEALNHSRAREFVEQRFLHWGTLNMISVYSSLGYKNAVEACYEEKLREARQEAQRDCNYATDGDVIITDARHDSSRAAQHTTVSALSHRTKKVIYSISWSKEDLSSAATREVPMTKEVVESLTALGHRVGEVAHDYVPALKNWLRDQGIKNSYDSWHGGKGVKKAIKKVASGLVRDAEKTWFSELSDKGMRDQLRRLLEISGLITSFHIGHTINAFSKDLELVKAIVCAGLFPNAVKVGLGIESKGKCGKKRVRLAFRTRSDGRVAIHPSSVNSDEKQFASQWLVYHDKVKSTQIFIRDSSMVHPVALILLSGKDVKQIRHEIRHGPAPSPHEPRVTLAVDGDRWMAFHCSPRLARVLQAIREEIKQMVSSSISTASTNNALFHHHTKLIEVISLLLTLPIQESYPNLG